VVSESIILFTKALRLFIRERERARKKGRERAIVNRRASHVISLSFLIDRETDAD
jgi:hypothetical protein